LTHENLNEAAVREEIIAPILRLLAYSATGRNDIRYELALAYPWNFLGRKKKTDPRLRGKADYVCRADGKVAWTVEAKGSGPITQDDIEQAYTYAKHAEVRAIYFCLCNGTEFFVYATDADPAIRPLLTVDCSNPESAARQLKAVLGVDTLLARYAAAVSDTEPPIGQGLASFAQIVGGSIVHQNNSLNIAAMRGFTISVTGGALQRVEDGTLLAYWESRAPYAALQSVINSLGLTRIEVYSDSARLSSDLNSPTIFQGNMNAVFPKGQEMLNLMNHEMVTLAVPLAAAITFRATGTLKSKAFGGSFELRSAYRNLSNPDAPELAQMTSTGIFEFLLR
jgi:hypothetical protein